ncbi:hypothetical protein M514_05479 [Trichuris suis]|uniref:Uncharacterized protein n=1 Tax=Trichuris suis TaxID=68888 RepID=A0A085NJL8_9BILA|nr:hypothetical protein M513_05479 [Trichuris suis]KFD69664.1 hypothetical protein M514_05479 [Trichuris suis]
MRGLCTPWTAWTCPGPSSFGCVLDGTRTIAEHGFTPVLIPVKQVNSHSHDSDAAHVGVTAIRTALKRRAEATMETPAVIM